MISIHWQIGFEIELLAPPGKNRLDLADAICHHYQGHLKRIFYPQSEPSKVPGTPIFYNLTLGYEILDISQKQIAKCVDDLTLQADLNRQSPPKPGWYRIVSDDERLLRLIEHHTNPAFALNEVLEPIGTLFGTVPEHGPEGMIRVNDTAGASIAIAVPLPGERERPCELITAPCSEKHGETLETLLSLARSLNFTAPKEGAIHLHFDATPMKSAHAIANLVNFLWTHGNLLKKLLRTNPGCVRLGPWPSKLVETVNASGFRTCQWPEVQAALQAIGLTKYCDFNLLNCIQASPQKNTIEIRILPVNLESNPILHAVALFEAIFHRAISRNIIAYEEPKEDTAEAIQTFLDYIACPLSQQKYWQRQALEGQYSERRAN